MKTNPSSHTGCTADHSTDISVGQPHIVHDKDIPNTFGIRAKAASYCLYTSAEELMRVLETRDRSLPLLHIGGGSNLLFLTDFPGLVLQSGIRGVEVIGREEEDILVRVGAGEVFDHFVAYATSMGWYGLENLSLIPGQVGASAVQNIGAYGVEAGALIEQVEGLMLHDGSPFCRKGADCAYAYRNSIFKQEMKGCTALTYVTFRLHTRFRPVLNYGGLHSIIEKEGLTEQTLDAGTLRRLIIRIREEKLPDPAHIGSAGSFFMNPIVPRETFERLLSRYPSMPHYPAGQTHVKIPAGWLIETCGWKGRDLGRAGVYERQALVLVNRGGATGSEVLHLCQVICRDVEERFGIRLRPEVQIIGREELA